MIDREHYEKEYPELTEKLHTVYDPEIPVDVFELGLIYDVQINKLKLSLKRLEALKLALLNKR